MVSVGDVGVDDGCEAEAGDDDAEAGDCLGEADGGWHGGGCWCLYPAQAGHTTARLAASGCWQGCFISQPHTQYCAILGSDHHTISPSHFTPSHHLIISPYHHLTISPSHFTLSIWIFLSIKQRVNELGTNKLLKSFPEKYPIYI